MEFDTLHKSEFTIKIFISVLFEELKFISSVYWIV